MAKREEQLKNEIAEKYFSDFETTNILGNVDFAVSVKFGKEDAFPGRHYLMWAEAKRGTNSDILDSVVQLIFTIGKARTFETYMPPVFLGAFDEEKIAFIPYEKVQEVFYQNDFDWTEAPSNHKSKEFLQLKELVRKEIEDGSEVFLFYYDQADKSLEKFIKKNFKIGKRSIEGLPISKNNFVFIYQKWCKDVKNTIQVDWNGLKKMGILDCHFFLADMLSDKNKGVYEKLQVILDNDHYDLDRKIIYGGLFEAKKATFRDGMKAHTLFWNQYKRPPRKEFWDYFIERADLLVPQDVRERKGSYFTPQIWVEKSQQYISDVLGEDWEDEYYVWDCCAGTGNMEVGLKNKYRVWASTIDMTDVKIMHERICNGANLLPKHVFQFDFLNDEFSEKKLPSDLLEIINDDEKRKKLIIYINPPYAEVSSIKGGKKGVNLSSIHSEYTKVMGTAGREVYTHFLCRIYSELRGVKIGEFSKLKVLQGSAFKKFRNFFKAELLRMFVCPANTFDNVKGSFPIGFKIWDTSVKKPFASIEADVYNSKGNLVGKKLFQNVNEQDYISNWVKTFSETKTGIGFLCGTNGNDVQHNNIVYILNKREQMANPRGRWINKDNLIKCAVYHSVRHAIEANWLNDRDQYLFPNNEWASDFDFQSDCLAFTLFNNNISCEEGTNHWIPYTEEEVGAQMTFSSHFMSDYIKGKGKCKELQDLFEDVRPIVFTPIAQNVMDAGRELWKYYHTLVGAQPNASFYDIRAHFQGRDERGRMNAESTDEKYMELLMKLRIHIRSLIRQIEVKVYKYGFLRK